MAKLRELGAVDRMRWVGTEWLDAFLNVAEDSGRVRVIEGPGPRFFHGPKPPGSRPWEGPLDERRAEMRGHFTILDLDSQGAVSITN
jgi:hypothetical protein